MGYSQEIYTEVEKNLYNMRLASQEESDKRKMIFYKRFPRAGEIERELATTAATAAKAVVLGGNTETELKKLRENNFCLRAELKGILKSVNLPENYLEIHHNCKFCCDEGFVDGIMCECMKSLLKKEAYRRLNNMSPLELSGFETFSTDYYSDCFAKPGEHSPRKRITLILNFCKKYAREFNKNSPGLLFTGNTGLGKTHLSLAIASEVIKKGYGVIYGSTQNIVSKMEKERFQSNKETFESERHFINCDLLIIDDLGTEFSTTFSNAAIYNVINSRIMMNKPTIISTNLSMRELEKNYTQRMVSRLIGNNIRLEFLGSDIRQRRMIEKLI